MFFFIWKIFSENESRYFEDAVTSVFILLVNINFTRFEWLVSVCMCVFIYLVVVYELC